MMGPINMGRGVPVSPEIPKPGIDQPVQGAQTAKLSQVLPMESSDGSLNTTNTVATEALSKSSESFDSESSTEGLEKKSLKDIGHDCDKVLHKGMRKTNKAGALGLKALGFIGVAARVVLISGALKLLSTVATLGKYNDKVDSLNYSVQSHLDKVFDFAKTIDGSQSVKSALKAVGKAKAKATKKHAKMEDKTNKEQVKADLNARVKQIDAEIEGLRSGAINTPEATLFDNLGDSVSALEANEERIEELKQEKAALNETIESGSHSELLGKAVIANQDDYADTAGLAAAVLETQRTAESLKAIEGNTTLEANQVDFKSGESTDLQVVSEPTHTSLSSLHGEGANVKVIKGKGGFKKAISTANNKEGRVKTDQAKLQGSSGEWTAYAVDRSGSEPKVAKDAVLGTSSRDDEAVAGVHNVYVNVVGEGDSSRITVSTGVIDSKSKADEFLAILKQVRAENPGVPVKLSMHQLNSFGTPGIEGMAGNETHLIRNEHAMAAYINREMQNEVLAEAEIQSDATEEAKNTALEAAGGPHFIIHDNSAFNGMTRMPGEIAQSDTLNVESAAVHVSWLGDLGIQDPATQKAAERLQENLSKIQDSLADAVNFERSDFPQLGQLDTEIDNLDTMIADLKDQIGETENASLQKELNGLEADRDTLLEARSHIENKIVKSRVRAASRGHTGRRQQMKSDLAAVSKHVKGMQPQTEQTAAVLAKINITLNSKNYSPASRVLINHLSDVALGASSQINCKSGLDRTGMARALIATMDTMLKDGVSLENALEFAQNIDAHTASVNEKLDALGESPSREALQDTINSFGADKKLAFQFQSNNLNELRSVGLPVTGRSTGVFGLKWHHDSKKSGKAKMDTNPHPGPMLPRFVVTEQKNEKGEVQTDTEGKVKLEVVRFVRDTGRLTEFGASTLSGLSALRGG